MSRLTAAPKVSSSRAHFILWAARNTLSRIKISCILANQAGAWIAIIVEALVAIARAPAFSVRGIGFGANAAFHGRWGYSRYAA